MSVLGFVTIVLLTPTMVGEIDHSLFDSILRENVRDQKVDYLSIRKNHATELRNYLEALKKLDLASYSREEQLAARINLYNATMIHAILPRLDASYSTSVDEWAVFDEPLLELGDKTLSLNQLEHEQIRAKFKEPRIHVALVCGAKSCPPLIPRAYLASDLGEVLESGMKAFVNDPMRNPVNQDEQRIALSQLFNWYADDFGGADNMLEYANGYHALNLEGYATSFTDYHWDLNFAHPIRGDWVQVETATTMFDEPDGNAGIAVTAVTEGEFLEVLERTESWVRVDRGLDRGQGWIKSSDATALVSRT